MTALLRTAVLLFLALTGISVAHAAETKTLPEHVLGKADAPLTIIEYASLTCSHCAHFYDKTLPEIEKRYIETGKVKFIYRDFPLDGVSLKAAALAQCLPKDQYYPFIKTLFKNQDTWTRAPKPEAVLTQFAQMAGLDADKTQKCMNDAATLDALVAQRSQAEEKFDIKATPTFIIGAGEDKLMGALTIEDFSAAVDKALAKKK